MGALAEGDAGGRWEASRALGGFSFAAGTLGSSAAGTLSEAGADAWAAADCVGPDAGSGWGGSAGASAGAVLVLSCCAGARPVVLCETPALAAGSTTPEGIGASTALAAASLGPALACVTDGLGPGAASEDAAAVPEVSSIAAAAAPGASASTEALLSSDASTGASTDSCAAAPGGDKGCGVVVGACNSPSNQTH